MGYGAMVADVENIIHWQAENDRSEARDMIAAVRWWTPQATAPDIVPENGYDGYAQFWDKSFAPARKAGLKMHPVPRGENEADRAVVRRLGEHIVDGATSLVICGVDHLVLEGARTVRETKPAMRMTIVAPTSYPRKSRKYFKGTGKWADLQVPPPIWIDDVLRKFQAARQTSLPNPVVEGRPGQPSPLGQTGRFWKGLDDPTAVETQEWRKECARRFVAAGYDDVEAEDLVTAIQLGFPEISRLVPEATSPARFGLHCLAAISYRCLTSDRVPSGVKRLLDEMLALGSRYVSQAIGLSYSAVLQSGECPI